MRRLFPLLMAFALFASVRPARAEGGAFTVYVTRYGKSYHLPSCRFLTKSRRPIPLSKAARRYKPCSHCLPAADVESFLREAETTSAREYPADSPRLSALRRAR